MSDKAILDTVAGFIRAIIGEDWADELDIDMDTSFSDDLELESIEFVALAEKMQEHFGAEVNFVAWISEMELDKIIGLCVGDVVEFIKSCR